MSRLDLLADLHERRPTAPAELRERVRQIAAARPQERRRLPVLTPRLALGTLVAAAAGLAIAVGVAQRGSGPGTSTVSVAGSGSAAVEDSAGALKATTAPFSARGAAPAPAPGRLQDYDASLSLRVRGPQALSDAVKQALAVARSLGGFATVVDVDVGGKDGDATLRLRVPVTKVDDAVARLSGLGTITGSSVRIQDLQAGVNATDREIARLQRQLRELRAQKQSDATRRQIRALTERVQQLQRARADTVRQARLATISLQLTTRAPATPPKPEEHGPLHGVVVALTWLGIGAVYVLALGTPVVLLGVGLWFAGRAVRRRSERRLLERR